MIVCNIICIRVTREEGRGRERTARRLTTPSIVQAPCASCLVTVAKEQGHHRNIHLVCFSRQCARYFHCSHFAKVFRRRTKQKHTTPHQGSRLTAGGRREARYSFIFRYARRNYKTAWEAPRPAMLYVAIYWICLEVL